MSGILHFSLTITIITLIYALLTLGLNVQWGYTGLLNFGHVAFFALGAYTSAIVTQSTHVYGETGIVPVWGLRAPFVLGLLLAILVAGGVAFLVGLPTLRLQGDRLAIMTIGLGEVIRMVLLNERWLTRGSLGLRDIPQPLKAFLGPWYDWFYLGMVLVGLLAVYALAQRVYHSPFGRVLRSIREDEVVAQAAGKDTFSFKMQAFVLGAMIAGAAGSLLAHFTTALLPSDFLPEVTFVVWTALILGGAGNNKGAIVGTILLVGVFQQATRFLPTLGAPYTVPSLRLVVVGLLLILVVRFRPRGLIPEDRYQAR
ncbi:MAG: branched-chain amino acid ABC transporter permease [Nitrospinota bacterium]|nr:MAG: branched-chain amino acid ABC transporter permease [Nitrospinota bacterium]